MALSSLAEENATESTSAIPGGTVTAVKLPVGDAKDAPGDLVVRVESAKQSVQDGGNSHVEVRAPRSMFTQHGANLSSTADDPIVIIVTVFEVPQLTAMSGSASSAPIRVEEGSAPIPVIEVKAAVNIDLMKLASLGVINVNGLTEPIAVSLPANFTPGMQCAYWDEQEDRWSTRGVSVSNETGPGKQIVCLTTHLTLFGAIFQGFADTFMCSQFRLFTAEAIARLAKGSWYRGQGMMFLGSILSLLLLTFVISAVLDYRRDLRMHWTDDFFLIPLYDGPPAEGEKRGVASEESEPSVEEDFPITGFICCMVCALCTCFLSFCRYLRESSAAREALDDIASNWFENFAEVRAICESLIEAVDMRVLAGGTGRVFLMTHRAMLSLNLAASQRSAASTMMVSNHVVHFILKDETLREVVAQHEREDPPEGARRVAPHQLRRYHSHFWSRDLRAPWQASRSATTAPECWTLLHDDLCRHVQNHVDTLESPWHLPRSMFRLFLTSTPFGHSWSLDIFCSCKMRSFFFAIELVGSLVLCSFFFEASGVVSGEQEDDDAQEECGNSDLADTFAYKTGRLIAIGMGSVLIAGIPVGFLQSLHTRGFKKLEYVGCHEWKRQLRAWELQDRLIWILGSAYLLFGIFFINLFLANINEDDHIDWATGGGITVLQDCVVLPAVVGFIVPGMADVMITLTCFAGKVSRKHLVQDMHRKLCEDTNVMLPIMRL